jgi:hypothetical protein
VAQSPRRWRSEGLEARQPVGLKLGVEKSAFRREVVKNAGGLIDDLQRHGFL